MYPESNGREFWSHSFHLPNSGILQRPYEMTIFKYKNEYRKQLELKK